ncbi:hypothetical protein [Streptomyces sp. S1D4-20]|uniref:hypothetical protein n=1 Tax=Streptomyces sp. S1D4-20 TaxID=2594462 RepID=UPI0011627F43|nr:hypothetical protein [Streptomyces sp. S1D4-20]QDN54209.1 hypothetical protein FNV67_01170 [Streptomyces sp. S1D4-20]
MKRDLRWRLIGRRRRIAVPPAPVAGVDEAGPVHEPDLLGPVKAMAVVLEHEEFGDDELRRLVAERLEISEGAAVGVLRSARRLLEGLREPWSTACMGDVALAAPTDAAMQLRAMLDHGREAVARVSSADDPDFLLGLALMVGTELRAVVEKARPQVVAPSPFAFSGGVEVASALEPAGR